MAAPFDLQNVVVTGPAVSVIDDVRTEAGLRFTGQYTFSQTGTLVYVPGISAAVGQFVWVDRQGGEDLLPFPARMYGEFRLSPDGERLATTVQDISSAIWIYALVRGGEERLTRNGRSSGPVWTPDGRQIVFGSRMGTGGRNDIYARSIDGGAVELLFNGFLSQYPTSFFPDGNSLLFTGSASIDSAGIHKLSLDENRSVESLIVTSDSEWGARFSPSGEYIAYISDEEGQYEVYIVAYPKTADRWKVSIDGGEEPVWSRTGRELFYRDANRWYVVPIETQPEFQRGVPELYVEGPYLDVPGIPHDVGLDGRLLLLKGVDEARTRTHLNVVTNWFEELKRLVPTSE